MKNNEVADLISFLDSFKLNYNERLNNFLKKKNELETDFNNKQNEINNHFQKTVKENENDLKKKKNEINNEIQKINSEYENEKNNQMGYLLPTIKNTTSVYRSVASTYFAIGAIGLILSFILASEISLITLLISFFGFYNFYNLLQEIKSLKFISSEYECFGRKLPLLYSLFNKPTLTDILKEEKFKFSKRIEDKYSNVLNQKEIEKNNYVKQIEDKQREILNKIENDKNKDLETLNNLQKKETNTYKVNLNSFIDESRKEVENIMFKLNTIHQLCNNTNTLIQSPNSLILSDRIYSTSFIYTHDEEIDLGNEMFKIPKFEKFGAEGNLFINSDKNEKNKVLDVTNEIILRQLIGIQATKVKVSMYDPVELGAFFSTFHNLHKDISGGIVYTSHDDLNEILDAHIRHISMVVQKLLQNKYENLDDYNLNNQEMAEPYRIIAINDFSNSFDDIQLKKINQILSSGTKCGVYVVIVGDYKSYKLISENNNIKTIDKDKFNPVFSKLDVDNIITNLNMAFENTGNIVVDINQILTKRDSWWNEDSSKTIALPIGKRGREIQELKFDNKDDNQALMIGKPGSGKSNLLHVILLSAITKYSPDDLEIYLIDFKGGVEFSVYADIELPHLKTIALESDREFGLSVIDGVEKELLSRESIFSAAGVQNLDQYNLKFPEKKLPRILFIVDEFQEFFNVEDDIKEEVSQKYDRIIRKGRAFGINSLFSSQTLEGKSIPRSTKELIDIRIALMCGDNDVREIMDDKNLAAKDLSRPGEAIYNAENGKVNGNQRFQAVFIERNKIVEIIESVSLLSSEKNISEKEKFIFRGDRKAFIDKQNHPLNTDDINKFKTIRFWLGEPISIDKDIFSDFKFTPSNNMLIVGSDMEAARVFSSINYCLNKQKDKTQNIFVCNPLTEVDEGYEDIQVVYSNSDNLTEIKNSSFDKTLYDLNNELNERKEKEGQHKSIFVLLNSVHRMRNIRMENDLEGISNILNVLLEDGPEFGIFFIIHFESIMTLKRTSIRMRNFNHRIAFQLNNDSYYELFSVYKIAPLKNNRALYFNDELGKLTIIKPYELFTK